MLENSIKKINLKLLLCFSVCVYRIMLDWCYINDIILKYEYYGFVDNRSNFRLFLSWICLIVSFGFVVKIINNMQERVSTLVVLILYLISYVPFCSCIYVGIVSREFIFGNIVYWIVFFITQKRLAFASLRTFPKITFSKYVLGKNMAKYVGIFSVILVSFISWKYTGFRMNFNLFSVYEYRTEALTYNFPMLIKYAFSWTKAINPILMVYCVGKKNYPLALCFFVSQIFSFGIDGQKSTLFMLPLGALICVFCKKLSEKALYVYTIAGITIFSICCTLEKIVFNSGYLIEFFIRRMMFLPNLIGNCYFDFFTKHEPDYFRASFMRYFGFLSPYTTSGENISKMIGSEYILEGMNCNNGLSSDAITNLGYIGVVIMPIMLGIVLYLLDRCVYGLSKQVIAMVSLYTAIILLSSFLLPALLTHGLLVIGASCIIQI